MEASMSVMSARTMTVSYEGGRPMNKLDLKKPKTTLILLVLFISVWTQRIHVRDFFDGVFQGYSMNSASHVGVK
jgi:hypothetical protein